MDKSYEIHIVKSRFCLQCGKRLDVPMAAPGFLCDECAKKIMPDIEDPVASHIGNYKAGWVYNLQDFLEAITDPLNPSPLSEFYHQCGRYRLNVFLNRYGELRIWLSQNYPAFEVVMKRIMSKYQYQWASDEILRNMGAEIEECAKEHIRRDRYGKQAESRRDDGGAGKIVSW